MSSGALGLGRFEHYCLVVSVLVRVDSRARIYDFDLFMDQWIQRIFLDMNHELIADAYRLSTTSHGYCLMNNLRSCDAQTNR